MKKRIISVLLVLTLVLTMFPAVFAAADEPETGTETISTNLIANGGFEVLTDTGTPEGAKLGAMTGAVTPGWESTAWLENENVYEGSNAVKLVNTGSGLPYLQLNAAVESNTDYFFSFKVKGEGPAAAVSVYQAGAGSGFTSASVVPNAEDWTTLTHVFNTGSRTSLQFLIQSGWDASTLYIDDVCLYPFSENLLENGGFETLNDAGAPEGVRLGAMTGAVTPGWESTAWLETKNVCEGKNAVKLVNTGSGLPYLQLNASVDADSYYVFSYKVKGEGPAAAVSVYQTGAGSGFTSASVVPNAEEWTTLSHLFNTEFRTSLQFLIQSGWDASTLYIDDVRLVKVVTEIEGTEPEDPEPDDPVVPELPEDPFQIPHEGTNYVVNGSFEDLDAAGKPVGMGFNGWGTTTTLVTDDGYVTNGSNAIKIDLPESGWSYANLRADVEPNTGYVLYIDGRGTSNLRIGADIEFWKNDSGDVDSAHIKHTDTGSYGKTVNPDSWTTMCWAFTTPAECHMMEIAVSIPWKDGTLYVDNVRVYRIANNLAENGGFENVEDGKAVGINVSDGWNGTKLSVETDAENVHEGSNALKLSSENTAHTWAQIPARNLQPGATYQVSFWMKGTLQKENGTQPTFGYDLELYTDNNGHNQAEFWGGLGKGASFPVTEDWQYCTEYFTLPDDIVAVNLTMGFVGATGYVYLDDVRIQKLEDAGMGELINDKVFYYPEDGMGGAEITFQEAYHVADQYQVDVALKDGDTVLSEVKDITVADNKAYFSYELSLMTEKKHAYTVMATVRNDDGKVVAVLSEDVYIYDRPTALNEYGQHVQDDGSVFNATSVFWGPDDSSRLKDLAAIGFNTLLWSPDAGQSIEDQLRELDDLHALGMKVSAVCFWNMEPTGHPDNAQRVAEWVAQLKDHPAIYAWNVADEPYATANPPEGMTVRDLMIASYKTIRDVDDKHPVTYVESDYRKYAQADDYADIILIDPYPGANSFASHVGDRSALICEKVSRPVGMLLQAFRFAGCEPSDFELHSMMYQSYLASINYLGYFGVGSANEGYMEDNAELWPVAEGFYNSGEWEILFKQYSSGKNPTIESVRESNVWYDVFEQDGMIYAALQNRTYGDVTVSLAGYTGFEAITWSDDVAVNAAIVDGALEVTLTEAQAVLLKLTADEPETGLKIVTQPASYEGLVGDTVEFTVEATGEGLSYQWFYKAVGSEDWQKSYSTGATTDTLSVELRAYRDGQQYKCVVTDANGETVESDAAAMTLKAGEFSITSQPASYAGAEGDTVTFTVAAEGDNLTYRWKYSTDGGETWKDSWSDGYATDTLTVELKAYRDGQQYKCVVTNAKGEAIESDAASMSLKESAIEITAQPENATVAAGETVTFTVEAEGENLKYRWYRSSDRETWTETWLAGYNTNELSFVVNASRAGYAYKCVITSGTNTVETEAVSVVIK